MSASLELAVAQFAPTDDAARNLSVVGDLARRAAARGAQLVVFPEYSSFFVDPFDASLARGAERLDGPFVEGLRALADDLAMTIVAGLVERTDGARVFNTVVAVDDTGLRATYRKQHLYDAFGQRESDWVVPGPLEPAQIFRVAGISCGLMTCYDLRFPESARLLVDAGADLLLVPAEWVRGPLKEEHWQTLLAARAIENTVFVAAADHPPPIGVGRSCILDPQGISLAALGTTTGIVTAPIELAELERVRRVNPALALRRYGVSPRD